MDDQIFIQRKFTVTDEDGLVFSDAIVLPQAEYEALTEQDIETIKQERFDNWQIVRSTPPPEPDPEEQLQRLNGEQQYLQDQLAQKTDELEVLTAVVEAGTIGIEPKVK